MTLILASASPRRTELLTAMGIPHEVRSSSVDEREILADHPRTFALRAAFAKARDVAAQAPEDSWVLAADTVVTQRMILFGKPESPEDARRILRSLSGQTHSVITGLALAQGGTETTFLQAAETRVTFRMLTEEEIASYVATGDPMDKAGAYGIQGPGGDLVERIEGDYFNVVGLPCKLALEMLEEAGLNYPAKIPEAPARWADNGRG